MKDAKGRKVKGNLKRKGMKRAGKTVSRNAKQKEGNNPFSQKYHQLHREQV